MSKWQINPGGVHDVLKKIEPDAKDLQKALAEKKFTAIFEGLTWGSPLTDDVPKAVQALFEDQQTNLSNISNHLTASQVGVANAVIAYNNGQEEMVGNFQDEAISAAESGDFSYFVKHGPQEV